MILPKLLREKETNFRSTVAKIFLPRVRSNSLINFFVVQAIEKINKIKEKREKHHILKRLQKGVELRKKEDVKLVETQMHLIKASHCKSSFFSSFEFSPCPGT